MDAIDTNILIYACDRGAGLKHDRSDQLLNTLEDAVIPWQAACEFIAASQRLRAQGFEPEIAWRTLFDWLRVFPLVMPTPGVLESARLVWEAHRLSHWDALLVAACLDAGVRRLYTEDVPAAVVPGIEFVNPLA